MKKITPTTIVRLGFLGWIVFEFLNLIHVLHFTLDFSWSGLMITVGSVWIAIELVSLLLKKLGAKRLPWIAYIVPLVSISCDAFGDIAHLYTHIMYYDKFAHTLGGAATATICFFVLKRLYDAGRIALSPGLLGFLTICITNLVGIIYEMEEYSETIFLHNNRMGDGFDTSTDIFYNIVGATTVVIIGLSVLFWKKNTARQEQEMDTPTLPRQKLPAYVKWLRICFSLEIILIMVSYFEIVQITPQYSWTGPLMNAILLWLACETIFQLTKNSHLPFPWYLYIVAIIAIGWNIVGYYIHTFTNSDWYSQVSYGVWGAIATTVFVYLFNAMEKAKTLRCSKSWQGFFAMAAALMFCSLYTLEKFAETKILHNGRIGSGAAGGLRIDNNFFWYLLAAIIATVLTAVMLHRRSKLQSAQVNANGNV